METFILFFLFIVLINEKTNTKNKGNQKQKIITRSFPTIEGNIRPTNLKIILKSKTIEKKSRSNK